MADTVFEQKVNRCFNCIETLVGVIYKSAENKSKYQDVSSCIAELFALLSATSPDKEAVSDACGKLKDVVLEYNDSGENLDVKSAASNLATMMAIFSSNKYKELLTMLRSKDKDGLLKHFVEAPASIEILEVTFANTDFDGNIIDDYEEAYYNDTLYLKPRIRYRVINTGPSIDIWYKIFYPDGTLLAGSSRPGFTWKGKIDRDEKCNYQFALGGFGNPNKDCYKECGKWSIEFYEGERMIYRTTFDIKRRPEPKPQPKPQPQPRPEPKPQPQPQPQPRPTPKPTYKRSLWQRFKDGIEAIGEWFDDDADTKIAVVLYALALIFYVVVVIAAWVDDGFFSALITGIVGLFILGIAYYAIAIICMVIKWVFSIIFKNVWTFFITLFLLLSWIFSSVSTLPDFSFAKDADPVVEEVETVIPTTTYYCISKKGLKVREYPSTSSPQLGSLIYGEAAEVYAIEGSFAKIKYDKAESGEAWVSSKYISLTPPSAQ